MDTEKIGVRVVYRDESLKPVTQRAYTLRGYTEMLRNDLLRLISDVEQICYNANHGAPKEEWSDETWASFHRLKHKLLDKAGDIGRLPDNLFT